LLIGRPPRYVDILTQIFIFRSGEEQIYQESSATFCLWIAYGCNELILASF